MNVLRGLLLFMGAGASVELGVPAMRAMALELHQHLANLSLPSQVFDRFKKMLTESDYDIERLIEAVDGIVHGTAHQKRLGFPVDEELSTTVGVMRQEAEWYVQHVCERLRETEARVLWAPAFRQSSGHKICLATTNYDRSVEIGARFSGVDVDDGFEPVDGREIIPWKGVDPTSAVQLLKIHGSTDWYHGSDARVYKLRHPMPLYGSLAVVDTGIQALQMKSALVLPTQEKRVNQPPYPDLVTRFRNAAQESDVAVFLGTSLRDPDILDICRQCAARIPTYLVSKDGPPAGMSVGANLRVVVQVATKFIASTLPLLLSTDTPGISQDGTGPDASTASVLAWLVAIQDPQRSPEDVCDAIEKLAENEVSLDLSTLSPLIGHQDPTVRSYAVALIGQSLHSSEVLALAQKLATVEPDGALANELEMLKRLGAAPGDSAIVP